MRSIKQEYYELAIKLAPGLSWCFSGKESDTNAGDTDSIPDLERSHMLQGS